MSRGSREVWLVIFIRYCSIRRNKTWLADNKDEIDTPDILLMLSEELVVFDNLRGTISFIINVDPHEVELEKLNYG